MHIETRDVNLLGMQKNYYPDLTIAMETKYTNQSVLKIMLLINTASKLSKDV